MEITLSEKYQGFCNDTKLSYYLNISAIMLILMFFLGRENTNTNANYFARIIIILLFSICLCINVKSSLSILEWNNMGKLFLNPSYNELKINILLNILYCIGLFFFITYLFSTFW